MVFLIALLYPNGRTHEAVLDRAQAPMIGTEFEMYGRTWRVSEIHDGRYRSGKPRRVEPSDETLRYKCVCLSN